MVKLRGRFRNKASSSANFDNSFQVASMEPVLTAGVAGASLPGTSTVSDRFYTRSKLPTSAQSDKVRKGWFFEHFRGVPNTHVIRYKNGKVTAEGDALTFRFRKMNTAVVEVPTNDRELQVMFKGQSKDFQEVNVQAIVTYRITTPEKAADRLDFSLDLDTGVYRVNPQNQLESMLTQLAQSASWAYISSLKLDALLESGPDPVRHNITDAFEVSESVDDLGLAISQVTVIAVRPRADIEKALQVPTFESLQERADVATFDRRAKAVEKERTIQVAEAASQLESSKRQAQLLNQQGANSRKQAEDNALVAKIQTESVNENTLSAAEAKAKATEVQGRANANSEKAVFDAFAALSPEVRRDLVLQDLAEALGRIENLTITPDLLTKVLQGLSNDS